LTVHVRHVKLINCQFSGKKPGQNEKGMDIFCFPGDRSHFLDRGNRVHTSPWVCGYYAPPGQRSPSRRGNDRGFCCPSGICRLRTDTWFPILDDVQTPVTDGRLGLWDTTSITDGNYQLRLYVVLENDSRLEAYARNLQVRNTTPAETQPAREEATTSTETPAVATETPAPTVVPVIQSQRSGTQKVLQSLKIGAILGCLSLLIFASYIFFRKIVRSRQTSPRFRRSKETRKPKQASERRDE
jgi:hypothetical protein